MKFIERLVNPFVQVNVLDDTAAPVALHVVLSQPLILRHTAAAATLVVKTGQVNLYFVLAFIGIAYLLKVAIEVEENKSSGIIDTLPAQVTLVVDNFNTFSHGIIAVSNSAEIHAASCNKYIQYFSSSIHHAVVLAVSPVALSILISSPH